MALSQADFNELVDQHSAALYRIAFRLIGDRHEAEDLVQEAFRSAWKSRARYEPSRGGRAWLVAILRRRSVDRWRKRKLPSVVSTDATLEASVEGDDPIARGYTDEMQQALGKLPDALRETLLYVVVAELTHQEVANLLEIPLGTVLSRVSRARQRLREYLLAATKS